MKKKHKYKYEKWEDLKEDFYHDLFIILKFSFFAWLIVNLISFLIKKLI